MRKRGYIHGYIMMLIATTSAPGVGHAALEVYPAVEREPPAPTPAIPFDPVPSQHRDSIAARLRIVETLIREHGRAYDYRTLTTQELQALKAELSEEATAP